MPQTINTRLYNWSVRHQIAITRYSTMVARDLVSALNGFDATVLRQVSEYDVSDGAGGYSAGRLQALLGAIDRTAQECGTELEARLDGHIRGLAGEEASSVQRAIQATMPERKAVIVNYIMDIDAPSEDQVYAAVYSRPFEGKILQDYYNDLPAITFGKVKDTIRQGFVNGRTTDQIIRDLRGTRAARYADGIMQQPRNAVERLVRTATNHTATTAREQVYANNTDLIKGVRWVSTLDMRTSATCQALDGKVFPPNEGPRPPAHFNCRSTTTPITKSWRELGFDIDDIDPGTRASMDGQVPATQTYNEWLSGQPANVQNEVLGPTRAELFRNGGYTVDKFVDDSGRALTLDELRASSVMDSAVVEGAFDLARQAATVTRQDLIAAQELASSDHSSLDGYIDRSSSAALDSYVGSGYKGINAALRSGDEISNFMQSKIDDINALMSPVEQDFIVYRGIDPKYLSKSEFKAGEVLTSSGFTSTSRSPYTSLYFSENGGIMFQMRMKKGTKALITNPYEAELILPHGTQFRVIREVKIADKSTLAGVKHFYEVELIAVKAGHKVRRNSGVVADRFKDNFLA